MPVLKTTASRSSKSRYIRADARLRGSSECPFPMRKGLVDLVRVRGTEVGAIVLNDEKPHDQTCCGERHGQGEPDRELQSGVHACDRRGVCECGGCQLND